MGLRPHDLETFTGNIEQFAQMAGEAARYYGLADESVEPNVRLIRDYLVRRIIRKPTERRGKELIFGFRHLMEFLAARSLLRDGWPLAKVAEYIGGAGDSELRVLVERPRLENDAVRAVDALMRKRDQTRAPADKGAFGRREEAELLRSREVTERQALLFRQNRELPELLRALGNPRGELLREDCVMFGLAPGINLGIARSRLEALTPEEAEDIGRAVVASLLNNLSRRSK